MIGATERRVLQNGPTGPYPVAQLCPASSSYYTSRSYYCPPAPQNPSNPNYYAKK